MNRFLGVILWAPLWAGLLCISPASLFSAERLNVTYIIASNQGSDIDIDNDVYRDEMIKLFSYSSYKQVDQQAVTLEPQKTETVQMPGGYDLALTIKGSEEGRTSVQAVVRKEGKTYVDTELAMVKPGVFFLGGPPLENGSLIIVLEMGF